MLSTGQVSRKQKGIQHLEPQLQLHGWVYALITPGIVHAPIKIYDEFAKLEEREYTCALITGHMGHSVKRDEVTLQPMCGWAMTITNIYPEYLVRNKIDN